MEIIHSHDFLRNFENKDFLLDTNIFIDAFFRPSVFTPFFGKLKNNGSKLMTIDFVVIEFLKGLVDPEKLDKRKEFIESFVDEFIPVTKTTIHSMHQLIQVYGQDGNAVSITDFILGAILIERKNNVYFITRNITDFPTNIFSLVSILNLPLLRSIHTYGVYTYN